MRSTDGEFEIDENTFKQMPTESQNWILYRTFNAHRTSCEKRLCEIEGSIIALEKKKNWNTTVGAGSGLIGGAMAYITARFIGGGQ